jgi:hypothetical protein
MHEDAPGTPDREVLARAQREGRALVTFDKDFGELAFRVGLAASAGVILFRITAKPRRRSSCGVTKSSTPSHPSRWAIFCCVAGSLVHTSRRRFECEVLGVPSQD